MKATTWFRTAAVLMLLFAAGHTFGFLAFRPPTAEGRAVWDAMNNVNFSIGRATFSYGRFYIGFGLFITAFQLFVAWLAWFLASISLRCPTETRTVATVMSFLQVIGLALSLKYFSLVPATFSAIAAICFAMAAISTPKTEGQLKAHA